MSFLDYNFRTESTPGIRREDFNNSKLQEPVRVIDVILDKHHPDWNTYGGPSAMGVIKYIEFNSNAADSDTQEETSTGIAYPSNIGNCTIPLKNEIVILVDGPDQNITKNFGTNRKYYTTVYSIWNNPHHGAFPPAAKSPDVALGEGITEASTLAPLQITPGDTLIQGRLGQSIRLGGGVVKDSPWSDDSNINKPLLILRAGQKEVERGFLPIFEDVDNDMSSIYMTTDHIIPLTLSNDKRDSYNSIPDLPSSYKGAQLLFNSNRVTINSKLSDVLISSAESVGINGTSVNIDSTDYLCLDADKMYLGSKARINEGAAKQPMVLGHRMEQFLVDVLDQMISLATAIGKATTIKGDKIPLANKEGYVVADVLKQKRSDLNPKGTSALKSKKIFVE